MRVVLGGIAAGLAACLSAWAVSEDVNVPDLDARKREAQERLGAEALVRHLAQREQAAARAQKIRELPPEQIAAWSASDQSDAVLERLANAPRAAAAPAEAAIPPGRRVRLEWVGALSVVLAVCVWLQRRKGGVRAP